MKKSSKYIVIGIVGIISFGLFLIVYFNLSGLNPPIINGNNGDGTDERFQVNNITLIIDYANLVDLKIYRNFTLANYKITVFDALQKYCEIEYKEYPGGFVYVEGIDDIKNNVNLHNYYWLYYVNSEYVGIGASHYKLRDGDLIHWNYTKIE